MLVNGQFVNATEWWDPHWIEDRIMRKLREAGLLRAAQRGGAAMTSHPTDAEKLSCLLKLAFGDDRTQYDRFCEIVRETVPEAHAAVLRGSAITGTRFVDGAPFDADGPGTSDLDLTLVGADVLRYYSAFWIPGIHSKPLSDKDPDIAPELLAAATAADGHGAPAGEHPGHARLAAALPGRHHESAVPHVLRQHPGTVKTVTNPQLQHSQGRRGARGRTLGRHLQSCEPDIVILQEAYRPDVVQQLAAACDFDSWASSQGHSVAFLSRLTIAGHVWRRVRWAKRAYLEIVTADDFRIYGVHLSAVHSNLTEQRRAYELRALLRSVERHQDGLHSSPAISIRSRRASGST